VSVVDQAVTPTAASGPARLRIVVVAAIFGALLGLGIVLARETLDDRVKTLVQAERQSRLPSLGAVPAMTTTPRGPRTSLLDHLDAPSRATPVQAIVLPKHPPSAVTDAYRTIRTSLLLARPGAPARTVLVASALDGDGKTTTAINLAAAFAQLDASVLVVDADLRRPSCHGLLGVPGAPGLSEVLCGRADLKQVLRPVPGHPLRLLPAGDTPPNPTELLGSDEMRELLTALAGQFDYVFVDSPAARGMADALVLSTLVDGVVVVARHEHTPRRLLAAVCDRFAYARAPMLGLVLNGVDDAADPYTPYITLHVTPGPPAPRRGTGERAA
jgi:capsular exopolysaccharide synthesis family protein